MTTNKAPARVAAIHDISCVGRCATTVILPTLSVLGAQVCPLPTALLSTHTGGFDGFTFLDLTSEMDGIRRHWQSLGITFDAVFSGFLGSAEQIRTVSEFVDECRKSNRNCLYLADPVMGDDGRRYATYTDEMCRLTAELTEKADIITPNLTEACLLLDEPYREDFSEDDCLSMLRRLQSRTDATVIVTGVARVSDGKKQIGAIYGEKNGSIGTYYTDRDPVGYPGTGDIFASIVLGGRLRGVSTADCVRTACDFIAKAAHFTTSLGTPSREGLCFEGLLHTLSLDESV